MKGAIAHKEKTIQTGHLNFLFLLLSLLRLFLGKKYLKRFLTDFSGVKATFSTLGKQV